MTRMKLPKNTHMKLRFEKFNMKLVLSHSIRNCLEKILFRQRINPGIDIQ